MTQIAAADTIRAEFHKVTLTNEGVRFVLSRTNNEFWVRMERLASTAQGEALPLSRPSATLYPQGGERAGKGAGEERFKVREQGPKEQPAAHEPPLTPSLSPSAGDRVAEGRRRGARAGGLGIACEACHGPGEHQVLGRKAEWNRATTPDARVLRSEIVHPKKIEPVRAAQVCGFCHSMKWIDKSERWRQTGFRYRPGDDLEGTTPIIRPSRGETIPGLADYLARRQDLTE